jgi:hypothetical protein
MPIDLVLTASFPAGPVLRPLRALADRLGMGVNLWSSPTGDVHDRQSTPDGARDWDVVLVRPADWSGHLDANVAELTGSLSGDTGVSPRRGTVVCICPSGQADDLDAERLADRLRGLPSTTVLTPTEIIRPYAVRKIVADVDWLDGPAYTHELYAGLAAAVMRVLDRRRRPPVKLVAVDADHTLWDGACGEDPPERLRLGPGRRAFHRRLAELRASGVLLCLLTRNHRPDVDRVFAHRPDLPVTLDDFTVVDASWSPKPAILRAACERLVVPPVSSSVMGRVARRWGR